MSRAALLLLSMLVIACSQLSAVFSAEAQGAGDIANKGQAMEVTIGDPREIFMKRLPKKEAKVAKEKEKPEGPESLGELFAVMKRDLKQAGIEFELFAKDIANNKRHTFKDPDFIPPERPHWR